MVGSRNDWHSSHLVEKVCCFATDQPRPICTVFLVNLLGRAKYWYGWFFGFVSASHGDGPGLQQHRGDGAYGALPRSHWRRLRPQPIILWSRPLVCTIDWFRNQSSP